MTNLKLALLLTSLTGCVCGGTVTIGGNDSGKTDGGNKDGGSPRDAGKLDGGQCTDGDRCGDGGVCAGGSCCAASSACGPKCCTSTTLCSFNTCVPPGPACLDSTECAATEFCDFTGVKAVVSDGGVCTGGALPSGRCLPRPPVCPATDGGPPPGAGVTCIEACTFTPATQAFRPFVRYAWGGEITSPFASDVMMAPIVTQLDDDDCDGKITANDLPDIVVVTFAGGAYGALGTVHALTVKAGALVEKWSRPGVINASSQLASGNIDGLPGNEIVGCGSGTLVALKADGGDLWTTPGVGCQLPNLADLDGDGQVEVVTEHHIVDGKTGVLKHTLAIPYGSSVVADLDGDGALDIITGQAAAKADGTELANTGLGQSFVAVADLDKDGKPEVIAMGVSPALTVHRAPRGRSGMTFSGRVTSRL